MKNSKTIQQSWAKQKAILKAKFKALTTSDFDYEEGRHFDFFAGISKNSKSINKLRTPYSV